MIRARALRVGLPRMHKESGERRDFLPTLVERLTALGCPVVVESGIGGKMGLADEDYLAVSPLVEAGSAREAFEQDVVLVLRAPEDHFVRMRPGATLISMLHFPTRPGRVRRLAELGLEAISLDSIEDDGGHRLVENMRAVGWNGVEAAFDALARNHPQLTDPTRGPVALTVLGAGTVGKHAIEAATKYGSVERNATFTSLGLPGVEVTVVGRNLSSDFRYMRSRLARSDILVDATQRSDPGRPLIPNGWLAFLPPHAVVCDLVVDPYLPHGDPPTVRSIEGIPQGDLDQWIIPVDDPRWERTVPAGVSSEHRRTVASCYSWPGIHPEECMLHYEDQLVPLLETLIRRGGVPGLRADSEPSERALRRGSLRSWVVRMAEFPAPARRERLAAELAPAPLLAS
jgi:alanine dehydrogenase